MSFIDTMRDKREAVLRASDEYHRRNIKKIMDDKYEENFVDKVKQRILCAIVENPLNKTVTYNFTIELCNAFNTSTHKYVMNSDGNWVNLNESINIKRNYLDNHEDVKKFIDYLKENFTDANVYTYIDIDYNTKYHICLQYKL